jgi:hypothetical protein
LVNFGSDNRYDASYNTSLQTYSCDGTSLLDKVEQSSSFTK